MSATWVTPGSDEISSRARSPKCFSDDSETSPCRAIWSAFRRIEKWLTTGSSVSSGKVLMPSTAFLISVSARATG